MKHLFLNGALISAALIAASSLCVAAAEPEWSAVERVGPPRLYAPPVERYRLGPPDVNAPSFYPIPKTPVTRATYMAWLEQSGMLEYVKQPDRGPSGPTQLLPVLAKYVQTGERHLGATRALPC